MKPSLKLNLRFVDRIGIVADISRRLADQTINITAMEVQRTVQTTDVYLEVDPDPGDLSAADLLRILSDLDGLQSLRVINTMPNEKRQNTFHTVLDNVSDGIVSIDAGGRITTINRIARTILNCHTPQLVGRHVNEVAAMDTALLDCLEGKSHSRLRRSVSTAKGQYEFFAIARPITDAEGRIIGAVEIMKNMKEITALVQAAAEPTTVSFDAFVGNSPAVKQAIAFARKIAPTPSIVSIRGESGTGKELFARAIHAESNRSGPFIPVNCAAIPDTLLESELFGYERGAFTGAHKNGSAGLFEQARDGTLFLDEIAELPPGPQAKILRAIQEKRVRRIGGHTEIDVDARIITATNRHLERLVEQGTFRQDLYYRINVLPIHLPPLKTRTEDIPLLANHFLFQINYKLNSGLQRLSAGALNKLRDHDWPGNVRELKNVIERAAILSDGPHIGAESIRFSFELAAPATGGAAATAVQSGDLNRQLNSLERRIIDETLSSAPSIRQAALRLGISHTTLRNKIRKHHL